MLLLLKLNYHYFESNKHLIFLLIAKLCLSVYQRWSRGHKARDQGQEHEKIRGQGQGQPFLRQTLSRPRTGMLEAKDQRHSLKTVFSKKKLFKTSFSSNLQFIGLARIFDWGGLNQCLSTFFEMVHTFNFYLEACTPRSLQHNSLKLYQC